MLYQNVCFVELGYMIFKKNIFSIFQFPEFHIVILLSILAFSVISTFYCIYYYFFYLIVFFFVGYFFLLS